MEEAIIKKCRYDQDFARECAEGWSQLKPTDESHIMWEEIKRALNHLADGTVSCVTCGKPVPMGYDQPYARCCSERCHKEYLDLIGKIMRHDEIVCRYFLYPRQQRMRRRKEVCDMVYEIGSLLEKSFDCAGFIGLALDSYEISMVNQQSAE